MSSELQDLTDAGVAAVLFDVGATLVEPAPLATPVDQLVARPLPGAVEAVRAVAARVPVAAVTDTAVMTGADVRALLQQAGFPIEVVSTSADVGADKPDPAVIFDAARRLGVEPSTTLVIGDSRVDQGAAAATGARFAATDHGVAEALIRAGVCARLGVAAIRPLLPASVKEGLARVAALATPPGALGAMGDLAARLWALSEGPPRLDPAAVTVFVADHGVAGTGVTPWPQEVTRTMSRVMAEGRAAVNAFARQSGIAVHVVDVGVATGEVAHPDIVDLSVAPGTADLSRGRAMSISELAEAVAAGATMAATSIHGGARLLAVGEMGIGNTTATACLTAALLGLPPETVTGRGSGAGDDAFAYKVSVVEAAVARTAGIIDPLALMSEVGGLELAAMTGYILCSAAKRVPVVLDGAISVASALVAHAIQPDVVDHLVAGHLSTEPAARAGLDHLGLRPLIDLDLRLGEGTGAALAVPLVQAAARLTTEVATLDQVTG